MRIKQQTILSLIVVAFFVSLAMMTSCEKEKVDNPPITEGENPDPEDPNPDPDPGSDTIAVTSITINITDLTLVRTTSEEIKATVLPEDASNKKVTWTSNNNDIAQVDATGTIKAIAPGTVTITAKAGSKTAECKVVVPNHDIYITGYQQYASGDAPNTARLWQNGALVSINQPSSGDAISHGFFKHNDHVYMVGNEKKPNSRIAYATLWTNGTPERLSDGNDYAVAYDVLRRDNDVFAVGYDVGAACYWKNNTKTVLHSATIGEARTIAFDSGGNLYIGGYIYSGGQERAVIWKNSNPIYLSNSGVRSKVSKIVIAGNDVYALGRLNNKSVIWKNQSLFSTSFMGSEGYINDIDVSGSDVYILGSLTFAGQEKVWKNGTEVEMNLPENGSLSKIQVVDEVVYIGGSELSNKIRIIANGKALEINPQDGATQTQITSMKIIKN